VAIACRSLRNQGRDRMDGWLRHGRLRFNYRMDELSAALGVSQIAKRRAGRRRGCRECRVEVHMVVIGAFRRGGLDALDASTGEVAGSRDSVGVRQWGWGHYLPDAGRREAHGPAPRPPAFHRTT
jgi:hypothetical protein